MRFYFERNEPHTESDLYAVCKQVSYHLGTPLDPEAIWTEVLAVRPGIDPAQRTFLDTCITACNRRSWRPADQTDVRVVSEKYGVVGMVDRIGIDGAFSIIRAAGALTYGTYTADRLRLKSCAICLQEMTGKEVTGGSFFRPCTKSSPYVRRKSRTTRSTHPATGAGIMSGARTAAGVGCQI